MLLKTRLIPVLLIEDRLVYKTIKFRNRRYIGDPVNIVNILNEKEVDELIILDIAASKKNKPPDFQYIQQIAEECFMPLSYGGGIKTVDEMSRIFHSGVEKIIINTSAYNNKSLISQASKMFGSSSVVAAIDIKKNIFGKECVFANNKLVRDVTPLDLAEIYQNCGAGEVFLNYVDNDGVMNGFNITSIANIAEKLNVPTVACGGAGALKHVEDLISATEISGVAAGSMFVYHGPLKAVLVNYPKWR